MNEKEVLEAVRTDARVLLERALVKKEVYAFGEDGMGAYGRHEYAKKYVISSVDVYVLRNEEDLLGELTGFVDIQLEGYDSDNVGLILSDQNFLLSVQQLLTAQAIDKDSLKYDDDPAAHDSRSVCMDINLDVLLNWP